MSPHQGGVLQARASQVRLDQRGSAQIRLLQVGPGEIGSI
jgi:hypothetical protein